MDEMKRRAAAASLVTDMEATAAQMREIIVAMPPHDLLGYIYAQHTMKTISGQFADDALHDDDGQKSFISEVQFLLEYVHAVLASDVGPGDLIFDEAQCAVLFELGRTLREQAMFYAVISSADTKAGAFGADTGEIEFHAKSSWVMIRGNRYQVLEGEFYRYVLAPHNDALLEIYGINAVDVSEGFQALANSSRLGSFNAITVMMKQYESAKAFATARGISFENAMGAWREANSGQIDAVDQAVDDMFRGGIANVSVHTKLPPLLLADLAYQRGEEREFFAPGDFTGTPFRTLPARKKPLIKLGSDYYAVDPCFTRDSGYRALLYNLLQRKPDYKKIFEERQKTMSEAAFADILAAQLPRAKVFQELYYKDPASNKWSENDTLILLDDVLFLIEAKAGAAATIASPALDFGRHVQSVQDLVVKAYKQCERFFNYLDSADDVPLYRLLDGKYLECGRVSRSDYRLMLPIGLTVESFSPFSSYCKALPQIEPLLSKYPFISMSIDDLFVLKRFLPTAGAFAHYMEVRQAVAGKRQARLYDEFDHLGAYLEQNRFDQTIDAQLKDGQINMLVWDGMCEIVDESFEGEDWDSRAFPTQHFPDEVSKLLGALDLTRARGWLAAESHIRNLGGNGRKNLAEMLSSHRQTLIRYPARYFALGAEEQPLFIWLQRDGHPTDWTKVEEKFLAAALAVKASRAIGVIAEIGASGDYLRAQSILVRIPTERTEQNAHIYQDAARMAQPSRSISLSEPKNAIIPVTQSKTGRNEACPCGSGVKFKRCHGK